MALCLLLLGNSAKPDALLLNRDDRQAGDGQLKLFNTHTNESLNVKYLGQDGQFDQAALIALNHFFRCHTDEKQAAMNPELFALLDQIQDHFGRDKTLQIISGYRSPQLNAYLHSRSNGVAKNSRHMLGQAIDIRIPGVPARVVYQYAWSLQRGGVGCYTGSNFVHVDVGPVRTWGV